MAKKINDTRVVTNEGRLSYAFVTEKTSIQGGPERFSTAFLFPKTDTETKKLLDEAIDAAIEAGVSKKFGGKRPNKSSLTLPIHDGDEKGNPNYEGMYYFNCNSNQKPQIVGPDKMPITDPTEIYSGCYAKISVSVFPYNTAGNKGIAFGLGNIMKTRDGEPLDGRSTAAEDFGSADDDDFLG